MRPTNLLRCAPLVALAALLCSSCNPPIALAHGIVEGCIFIGSPLANPSIHVVRLDNNYEVGTYTGDAKGCFSIDVEQHGGPFLLYVSGGTYNNPLTGQPDSLGSLTLTAILTTFGIGDHSGGLRISVMSHLASVLTQTYINQGMDVIDADAKAWAHLNAHFGGLDWRTVQPIDLASLPSALQFDDRARASLVIAGLAQEAQDLATRTGAGVAVNLVSLLQALGSDLDSGGPQPGIFDGQGKTGPILLPPSGTHPYALDGQTVRGTLGLSILRALGANRIKGAIKPQDAAGLISAIDNDTDPVLFGGSVTTDGGTPDGGDGGSPDGGAGDGGSDGGVVSLDPPVITWIHPSTGDTISAPTAIELVAESLNPMSSLTVTTDRPGGLQGSGVVTENGGHRLRLTGTLAPALFSDGPLTLTANAADAYGIGATSALQLGIANHSPTVTVSSGGQPLLNGTAVQGTITVTATAAPFGSATIVSVLPDPPLPAGAGAVTSTSGSTSYSWDTRQVPEGQLTTIAFKATDNLGAVGRISIAPNVTNYSFGRVTAVASAGNPVAGGSVTVNAITPDGQVDHPIGSCPGLPAEQSGNLACDLSSKNWKGTIQLVVTGISYTDPSDGTATVRSPSDSYALTAYVASYDTNSSANRIVVPVTMLSTLRDAAALALLRGQNHNAGAPTVTSIAAAIAAVDRQLASHLKPGPTPWPIGSTFPWSAPLLDAQLSDRDYASLLDLALNQLARDNASPSVPYNGLQLAAQLLDDVSADGVFDGQGAHGALVTPGPNGVALDSNTLRFATARALNEYLRGSANTSKLTTDTLVALKVYKQISEDPSWLFGTSPPPTTYGTTPPDVTIDPVVFHGFDGNTHAPISTPNVPNPVVRGLLDATANASSVLGQVTKVTLSGGGQNLNSFAGSSTAPVSVSGSIDTTKQPAGVLTLSATATDSLGNSSPAPITRSVTVDNDAPQLVWDPENFADGVYCRTGASLTVKAHATDATGITSFTLTGLQGWSDPGVSSPAPLNAAKSNNWNVPLAPDGAITATLGAQDLVGNTSASSRTLYVDNTSPSVTFASADLVVWPAGAQDSFYTTTAKPKLAFTADDGAGAGPANIYWQVDRSSPKPGPFGSISISSSSGKRVTLSSVPIDLTALTDGPHTVELWADDYAYPMGNSGSPAGLTPHVTTFSLLLETNAPTPLFSAKNSFRDETNLFYTYDPSGKGLYQYNGTNVGIAPLGPTNLNGTVVHKAPTRMTFNGKGNVPTLAELTGGNTNTRNFPYIDFEVPDANLTKTVSCDFQITVGGQRTAYDVWVTSKGASLVIPSTTPGAQPTSVTTFTSGLGDPGWMGTNSTTHNTTCTMPVSFDTIPELAGVSGSATVTVVLYNTDQIGKQGNNVVPVQFIYAPVSPPVRWVSSPNGSDSTWATSVAYKGASGYAGLYSSSTGLPAEGARYARFQVENPEPVALSLSPALSGAWQASESWQSSFSTVQAGTCFAEGSGFVTSPNACGDFSNPCSAGVPSGGPTGCITSPPTAPGSGPQSTGGAGLSWRAYPLNGGVEGTTPLPVNNGSVVLPASGSIAIYIGVPTAAASRSSRVPQPTQGNLTATNSGVVYSSWPSGATSRVTCSAGIIGVDPSLAPTALQYSDCYPQTTQWRQVFLPPASTTINGSALGITAAVPSVNGLSVAGTFSLVSTSTTTTFSVDQTVSH